MLFLFTAFYFFCLDFVWLVRFLGKSLDFLSKKLSETFPRNVKSLPDYSRSERIRKLPAELYSAFALLSGYLVFSIVVSPEIEQESNSAFCAHGLWLITTACAIIELRVSGRNLEYLAQEVAKKVMKQLAKYRKFTRICDKYKLLALGVLIVFLVILYFVIPRWFVWGFLGVVVIYPVFFAAQARHSLKSFFGILFSHELLATGLIAAILYEIIPFFANPSWTYAICCVLLTLYWCISFISVDYDIAETVGGIVNAVTTILLVAVNVIAFLLPENPLGFNLFAWENVADVVNLALLPFVIAGYSSTTLVSVLRHCEENKHQVFFDVDFKDKSFRAINTLGKNKLVVGRGDGNFDPYAHITYGEFAIVLCRITGEYIDSDNEHLGLSAMLRIELNGLFSFKNKASNEPVQTIEVLETLVGLAKYMPRYNFNVDFQLAEIAFTQDEIQQLNEIKKNEIDMFPWDWNNVIRAYNLGIVSNRQFATIQNLQLLVTRKELCRLLWNMGIVKPDSIVVHKQKPDNICEIVEQDDDRL